MEVEIAAVITVEKKLETLEALLDKRIERASLDTVSPTLPLMQKVYKLGEYKRMCVNLAVMAHRIRCALGDEADEIARAANSGADLKRLPVKASIRKAYKVLRSLGVEIFDLREYKKLPLYAAECKRLTVNIATMCGGCGAERVWSRGGKTAQAL